MRQPGAAVTAALQAYADRGVFRGFDAVPSARGRPVTTLFATLDECATGEREIGGKADVIVIDARNDLAERELARRRRVDDVIDDVAELAERVRALGTKELRLEVVERRLDVHWC